MTLSEYQKKKYGSKGANGKEGQKTESEPSSFAEARYRVLVHDYDEYGKVVNSFGDNYRSSDSFSTMSQRLNDLEERRASLDNYFTKNKYYDKNKTLSESMTALRTFGQNARNYENNSQKFWSQFANEDAYNYAVKRSKRQSELSAMSDDELRDIVKSNRTTGTAMRGIGLIGSGVNKIFNELGIDGDVTGTSEILKHGIDNDAALAQSIIDKRRYARLGKVSSDDLKYLGTVEELDDESKALIDEYTALQSDTSGVAGFAAKAFGISLAHLDARKAEIQKALEDKGVDDWQELVNYNQVKYDEQKFEPFITIAGDIATESPFLSSVASVGSNAVGGLTGIGGMVQDAARGVSNPNSAWFLANNITNEIRSTVTDNYDLKLSPDDEDSFDALYYTVLSSADSILAGVIGGGVGEIGGTLISAQAATNSYVDAVNMGADTSSALILGVVSGINEYLWEAFSISRFSAMAEKGITSLLSKEGIKTAVSNLAKSVFTNATEEFNTEVANLVFDYLVNGGVSKYGEVYQSALAEGKSDEEAKEIARKAMTKQALEAGLGGALQGLFMGGIATGAALIGGEGGNAASNFVNDIARGKQLKADGTFSAIQEQISDLDNEKLQKQADKVAQKMADGKKVSARKLGSIQRKAYMESSAQAAAATEEAVTAQLKEYGDKSPEQTAKTLVNMFKGKEVDSAALAENEAAQRVISEYFSEEGANWVSDLNSKLVNARNAAYKIASGTSENIIGDEYKFPASERQTVINSAEYGTPVNTQMRFDNEISQIKKAQSELAAKADAEMFDTEDMTVDNDNGTEEFAVNVGDNGEISSLIIDGDNIPISEAKLTQSGAELVSGLNYISKELNLDMGTTNVVLGEFYNTDLNAKDYIKAARLVVRAGQIGNASMLNSELAKALPENVRNILYSAAREARINKSTKAQSVIDKAKGKKKGKTAAVTYIDEKGNRVSVENFSDGKALKEVFKGVSDDKIAQIMFLSDVASALGTDITFTNTRGGTKLYNAFYNGKTNSFNINIDAGRVGEEYMTFSASHELTHFIKQWSPAKYNEFADYLVQAYSENGADVESLIRRKIELSERIHDAEVEKLNKAHPEWSDAEIEAACETYVFNREQAFDEVVADSCESFLLDSNITERLKELQQQDMSLFDKVCDWLSKFIDNLKKVREIIKNGNYSARSVEAQLVKGFGAQTDTLIKLWEDALADAREASVSVDGAAGNGSAEQFQLNNNVEETKELIAVHNLSENSLLKALGLGGLPMPSIAIFKAKDGHSRFGSISLVFAKNSISPEMNKLNKIYGGDAWTPTFPQIEYKINEKFRKRFVTEIREQLSGTQLDKVFGYLGTDEANLEKRSTITRAIYQKNSKINRQ